MKTKTTTSVIIELPVATIQHQALYTNKSPLTIAIKSIRAIENYNELSIDTRHGMFKMAEQLVDMTRNESLDNF
ncbi:hypothetical protein N8314_03975 [Akkermansiaceae bacterium]|nr:hypothetical protein [Akkermansiaceae bacterium]